MATKLSRDSERFLYPFFHKNGDPSFLSSHPTLSEQSLRWRKGGLPPPLNRQFFSRCTRSPWSWITAMTSP